MLFINNKSLEAFLYDVHTFPIKPITIFLIKPITIKNYTFFLNRTDDKFSYISLSMRDNTLNYFDKQNYFDVNLHNNYFF